jgi:hypothetical protein
MAYFSVSQPGFRGHPPRVLQALTFERIPQIFQINFIAFTTYNDYKTTAIMQTAEEAIKCCSATLKLKGFLTQRVPQTFFSLVVGFRKHIRPSKGFLKEKKVQKHWLYYY